MKNLELLQKQFNLFQQGDVVKASIITRDEDFVKVKTLGGCFGQIDGYVPENLEAGSVVEVFVTDVVDGTPRFALTEDFMFDKVEQNAVVCFAAPRSVVVEFVSRPETYGLFEPAGGLDEKFSKLKSGDKVTASQIKKGKDCYQIGFLKFGHHQLEEPEEETEQDVLAPWSKEKIDEVRAQGSRKGYGKLKLGYVYAVTKYHADTREIQFEDGQVGDLNVHFPSGCKRAFVRVTYISQSYRPTAELVSKEEDSPENRPTYSQKRNWEVYKKGFETGSLERAGGYWLGYVYNVNVVDGIPFFPPSDKVRDFLVSHVDVVVSHTAVELQNGDKVQAEVLYIEEKKDKDGNAIPGNYIIHITVLRKF